MASEQFADSLDVIKKHTGKVLAAYKTAYLDLFDRRRKAYQKSIDEIKNRPEWETVAKSNSEMAESLLSPLRSRLGSERIECRRSGRFLRKLRSHGDGIGSGGC